MTRSIIGQRLAELECHDSIAEMSLLFICPWCEDFTVFKTLRESETHKRRVHPEILKPFPDRGVLYPDVLAINKIKAMDVLDVVARLGYTVKSSSPPKNENGVEPKDTSTSKDSRKPEAGCRATSSLIDEVLEAFGPYDGSTKEFSNLVVEEVLQLCGQANGTQDSVRRIAKFLVLFYHRPGKEINGQFLDVKYLRELYSFLDARIVPTAVDNIIAVYKKIIRHCKAFPGVYPRNADNERLLEAIEKELVIKKNQRKRAKSQHMVNIKKESKIKMREDVRKLEELQTEYLKNFLSYEAILNDILKSDDPLKHRNFDDAIRMLAANLIMPFARRPGFLSDWSVEDFDNRMRLRMDDGKEVTVSRDLKHKTSDQYALSIILSLEEDRVYNVHRKICAKIGRPLKSPFLFTSKLNTVTGKFAYHRFNKIYGLNISPNDGRKMKVSVADDGDRDGLARLMCHSLKTAQKHYDLDDARNVYKRMKKVKKEDASDMQDTE